jgi:uncharacterized membrane protein
MSEISDMRVTWKTELPQLFLVAAMFVAAVLLWSSTPDRIPVHWNASGQPDHYGGKLEGLLLLPLTTLGVYLLLLLLPRIDPRRTNYAQFQNAYSIMRVAIVVFLVLTYGFVLLSLRGIELGVSVILILAGMLLILVGALASRIRTNWYVGIRTPWTLTSELSWRKTHRLGGWLLAAVGLGFVASGLVGSATAFQMALIFLFVVVLLLFIYSYLVWRADPERSE